MVDIRITLKSSKGTPPTSKIDISNLHINEVRKSVFKVLNIDLSQESRSHDDINSL